MKIFPKGCQNELTMAILAEIHNPYLKKKKIDFLKKKSKKGFLKMSNNHVENEFPMVILVGVNE